VIHVPSDVKEPHAPSTLTAFAKRTMAAIFIEHIVYITAIEASGGRKGVRRRRLAASVQAYGGGNSVRRRRRAAEEVCDGGGGSDSDQ